MVDQIDGENQPIRNNSLHNSLHGVEGEPSDRKANKMLASSPSPPPPPPPPPPPSNGNNSNLPPNPRTSWFDGVLRNSKRLVTSSSFSDSITAATKDADLSSSACSPTNQNHSDANVLGDDSFESALNMEDVLAMKEKLEEQQEELDALRIEAAYHKRLNSEWISQNTENSVDSKRFQGKIAELTKEITAEQSEKYKLKREINELSIRLNDFNELLHVERSLVDGKETDVDQQVVKITRELGETKLELQNSNRTTSRLQKEHDAIRALYDQKFSELQNDVHAERQALQTERESVHKEREEVREQLSKLRQQESNTGEWKRQLYQKDDIIKQLQNQLSELNNTLKSTQDALNEVKTKTSIQEQYRLEESQDLRVLNDSQEQQINQLKIEIQGLKSNQVDSMTSERNVIEQNFVSLEKEINNLRSIIEATHEENRSKDSQLIELQTLLDKSVTDFNERKALFEENLENCKTSLEEVQLKLSKADETNVQLQKELHESEENHKDRENGLLFTMTGLNEERDKLEKQIKDLQKKVRVANLELEKAKKQRAESNVAAANGKENASVASLTIRHQGQVKQLQVTIEQLQKKCSTLERNAVEAKVQITALEDGKKNQKERQHLEEKKTSESMSLYERAQRRRAQRIYDPDDSSVKTENSTASATRVTSLLAELETLKAQLGELQEQMKEKTNKSSTNKYKQSSGSLEEDLRKELENSRKVEKKVSSQLLAVTKEKDHEISDLQSKLDDREATITSLVRSTIGLENQIEKAGIEIDTLRLRLAKEIGPDKVKLLVGNSNMSSNEYEKLRDTVASNRASEESLKAEIVTLKNELQNIRNDYGLLQSKLRTLKNQEAESISPDECENDLHDDEDDDARCLAPRMSPQMQLKERDDAISRLVKQTMKQDKVITKLREQCQAAVEKHDKLQLQHADAPAWEEVLQLRQEAEVFAGQVIEQDEEIEQLKTTLIQQEHQITSLEKELSEMKYDRSTSIQDSTTIRNLEAEIDELRESNNEQLRELRDLRKKATDLKVSNEALQKAKGETVAFEKEANEYKVRVDELSREKEKLLSELEDRTNRIREAESLLKEELKSQNSGEIEKLKCELEKSQREIVEIKTSPNYLDEIEIDCMKADLRSLKANLENQNKEVEVAHLTIRELEGMLAEKAAEEAAAHEDEKEELLSEIESLHRQLEDVREELDALEKDRSLIDEYKNKLEEVEGAREASEEQIISTYERKLTLLALDKDVNIDGLQKQLFEEKEANATELQEMSDQVRTYQVEVSELRELLSSQINDRDTRIYALERTLEAQEQLVGNMKTEMDHLQGSMESSIARRRQEVDEMQQELLTLTAANTKMEREIKTLQLELDSREMSYQTEVTRLKEIVFSYETQNQSEHRTAADLQMDLRMKEVKDRLEKLKWRNTSLKEENENLRERLEIAEYHAKENSRQIAQMEELRNLVSNQCEQISELQTELAASREIPSPPVEVPPPPIDSRPVDTQVNDENSSVNTLVVPQASSKPPMVPDKSGTRDIPNSPKAVPPGTPGRGNKKNSTDNNKKTTTEKKTMPVDKGSPIATVEKKGFSKKRQPTPDRKAGAASPLRLNFLRKRSDTS